MKYCSNNMGTPEPASLLCHINTEVHHTKGGTQAAEGIK